MQLRLGAYVGVEIGGEVCAGIGALIAGAYSGWILDVASNAYGASCRLYLTYDWRPPLAGGAWLCPDEY